MNSSKLWQLSGNELHPLVEAFTVGDDHIIDLELLPYDIQASLAHVKMLYKMGMIESKELLEAKKGLKEILKKWRKKTFFIHKYQEDGHTAIEQYLTEKYGDIGKKIHTGRSRNDQSLVMIRLFMKAKLLEFKSKLHGLRLTFQSAAQKYQHTVMPGYTHLQKAMPTTVGMWLGSFAAGLKDFKVILKSTLKIVDQNPLGSASGFGIENFSCDRAFTTKQLGFAKTQTNPIYCSLSRGYFESTILQILAHPMFIAARFAHDM